MATETWRRGRRSGVVALLLLTLFVLTGCVKINSDLEVSKDLLLTGTMTIELKKSAYEDFGEDPDQLMDDALSEMTDMTDRGVSVQKISDDVYVGMGYTFEDVDVAHFTETDLGFLANLQLTEADGVISMSLVNPVNIPSQYSGPYAGGYGGAGGTGGYGGYGAGGPDSLRSMLDESVLTFTFPGTVRDAPGADIEGNTVSWNLQSFDDDELTAQANASSFPWWILIVVAAFMLAAVIALVIVLLVMNSKKKQRAMPRPVGMGAPDGPGYLGGPGYSDGRPPAPGGPGYWVGGPGYDAAPQPPYPGPGGQPSPPGYGGPPPQRPGPGSHPRPRGYGGQPPGPFGSGPQPGSGKNQPPNRDPNDRFRPRD